MVAYREGATLDGKRRFWMRTALAGLLLVGLPLSGFAVSEFEAVVNSYGKLRTAAGRGQIGGKGVNGWTEAMEGGYAVDAELSRPHMTMADGEGNLYIADKDGHAVRKVTTDGRIHTVAGTGEAGFNGDGAGIWTQLDEPNGLFTFDDGTTYILDLGNDRIRKLSAGGDLTTVVHDPDGIELGRGLWVSEDQKLIYYTSYDEYRRSGLIRKWTEAEGLTTYASDFVEPANIAVDPADGNLVVTDRGVNMVYKVFSDGSRATIAGNGETTGGGDGGKALETGLNGVRGICFGPNGGYYLATHEGGQVWYVDTGGYIHLLIDGDANDTHAGDGEDIKTPGRKISEPRAVSLAPNGDLIVTENDYGYVRVVEKVLVVLETNVEATGDFTLTWSSVPGTSYTVQFKDDPGEAAWEDLGTLPAADADIVTLFTHHANGKTRGFYRAGIAER